MTDYQRIAAAITYIRHHVHAQPTLADVAAHVHLSPYHFQRLFRRWAGVTPKRYLQALTLAHIQTLLRHTDLSVRDASLATGLSGGSRVYDHFIQLAAVTPSEYRSAGAGLTIAVGLHQTPYGTAYIATTPRGVCRLHFIADTPIPQLHRQLQDEWPHAHIITDPTAGLPIARALSAPPGDPHTPITLRVRGTNFQIHVWRALLAIPPGHTTTYSAIATAIGRPRAARAVGTAIGANPIACLIPCHRVLRRDSQLGGYRWGPTRKQAILTREALHTTPDHHHQN